MSAFKVGDTVRAINKSFQLEDFTLGKIYTIKEMNTSYIQIIGDSGQGYWCIPEDFELLYHGTPTVKIKLNDPVKIKSNGMKGILRSINSISDICCIEINPSLNQYAMYSDLEYDFTAATSSDATLVNAATPWYGFSPSLNGFNATIKTEWDKEHAGAFINHWTTSSKKVCDCGTTKTYGAEAQIDLHSLWCSMRSK